MIEPLRAEFFALCHTCRVRHPCFSYQGYLERLRVGTDLDVQRRPIR